MSKSTQGEGPSEAPAAWPGLVLREAARLTLADVSARTGMAVESLSRLETGAQTNPTWKTLGLYAAALGRRPRLEVESAGQDDDTECK